LIDMTTTHHLQPSDDHRDSRRGALTTGLRLAAGIAIYAGLGARVAPAATKLTKESVQYEAVGKVAGKDCDDCLQFIPGANRAAKGTCKIVDGDIDPHGHCIAFTPKPK
jgi:hypothetical protein